MAGSIASISIPSHAAERLGLSKRTLQRNLTEEGTTFQKQLNSTREVLARHYILAPWNHIAFTGVEPWRFINARPEAEVFRDLFRWMEEDDVCLWWADIPEKMFQIVMEKNLHHVLPQQSKCLLPAVTAVCAENGNVYKLARGRGIAVPLLPHVSTNDVEAIRALLQGITFDPIARSVSGNEIIKVKFEVDTTPPPHATFERKYRLMPIPYEINLYDMPSLFAGKLHAVICRAWKSRVKGRDLYDYVFYLSRNTPVNLKHLNARLLDSGFEGAREDLSLDEIKEILRRRFESIDFNQAREDVIPFIKNPSAVDVWSQDFFAEITENLKAQSRERGR